jgi:hypothetical protein
VGGQHVQLRSLKRNDDRSSFSAVFTLGCRRGRQWRWLPDAHQCLSSNQFSGMVEMPLFSGGPRALDTRRPHLLVKWRERGLWRLTFEPRGNRNKEATRHSNCTIDRQAKGATRRAQLLIPNISTPPSHPLLHASLRALFLNVSF